jgi:hypothetical protein
MLITGSSSRPCMIRLRWMTVCFMVVPLRRCHWGQRVTAVPWLFPAARDPLFGLVGARFASGGGFASPWPRRRPCRARPVGLVARRDLVRRGVQQPRGQHQRPTFHTGLRFVTERAIRTPGTDEPRHAMPVPVWTFTRLFGWHTCRVYRLPSFPQDFGRAPSRKPCKPSADRDPKKVRLTHRDGIPEFRTK